MAASWARPQPSTIATSPRRIDPLHGRRSPTRERINVVLPAPFSPISAVMPGSKVHVMSKSTWRRPYPCLRPSMATSVPGTNPAGSAVGVRTIRDAHVEVILGVWPRETDNAKLRIAEPSSGERA